MGNWITQLIPEFVAGIVLMIVLPLVPFIWVWLKSLPKPYILPIVMVCFASGLTIFEKIDWKKPSLSPLKVERNIQNWLTEAGLIVSIIPDENAHFRFVASSKLGDAINVGMFKSKDEYLILLVKFTLKDKDQETISRLNPKDLDNLLINIKESLIYLKLLPTIKTPLKEIIFEKRLFASILTKPNFFESLLSLQSGRMIIASHLHTALVID